MRDLDKTAVKDLFSLADRFAKGEFLLDLSNVNRIKQAKRLLNRLTKEHIELGQKLRRKWELLLKLEKNGVFM